MRIRPTVTALMAAGFAASAVVGCSSSGGSGSASSTITIGLVQGQDFTHAMPARIADAEGFFTKQGLTVKIVAFTSGSDLTKAMVGGSVNVGAATGLDVVSAAAKGIDLRAFYGVRSATPMSLLVGSKSTVTSFTSLKGKKLGISAFGSMTDFDAKLIAEHEKFPAGSVTEVPLGAPSANLTSLVRGDVAATLLPVDFGFALEAQGTGKVVASVKDLGQPDQFGVLMASSKYLSGNAANVKKLAAAYAQAMTFIQANKAKTVAVEVTALGKTAVLAAKTYDALAPGFTPDGTMNATGLAAYAQALPALKITPTAPAAKDYLDSSFTSTH